METKKYNILWIDDQHEELREFKDYAESENIILTSFKSSEEGIEYLEKNLEGIDGVLLDAKFFKSKNQLEGTEDLKGLIEVVRRLESLKEKKFLPYFILSGQKKLENDNTFRETYDEYYKKYNLEDIKRLFNNIKIAADKLPDFQIKNKYQRVLEVYDKSYLDDDSFPLLFDLLKSLDECDFLNTMDDKFNNIRKVIEAVFYACNKWGILHDDCLNNGKVNQTRSRKFLSGTEVVQLDDGKKIKSSKRHFPQIISRHVQNIIEITGSGSHYENPHLNADEDWRVNLRDLRSMDNSPYLFKSLVFQLLDVILWLKAYLAKNPDVQKNKSYWTEIPTKKPDETDQGEWVSGCVLNLNERGFAFFKPDDGSENSFIPEDIVKKESLTNGMKVKAETETYLYKGSDSLRVTRIKQE